MIIICIVNIIWLLYLPYYIYNYRAKKKRKIRGIIEATYDVDGYQSLVSWIIFYILYLIILVLSYLEYSTTGNKAKFVATSIFFLFPLIIIYYFTRWRIILEENGIIKYGIFKKKYEYEEITEVKYKGLTYTFYNGKKRLFSMCVRGHDFPRIFIPTIEKRAGLKDDVSWM